MHFPHLCNIAPLRPSLTLKYAETLVHAFITSWLNYCNAFSPVYHFKSCNMSKAKLPEYLHTPGNNPPPPSSVTLHWLPITHHAYIKKSSSSPTKRIMVSYLNELLLPSPLLTASDPLALDFRWSPKPDFYGGQVFQWHGPHTLECNTSTSLWLHQSLYNQILLTSSPNSIFLTPYSWLFRPTFFYFRLFPPLVGFAFSFQ